MKWSKRSFSIFQYIILKHKMKSGGAFGKWGKEGIEKIFQKSKIGVDFCRAFAYNNFRSVGELCNGSTYDSDSYCLGSNPSSPANGSMVKRLRRRPLKAKSGVRFPLGLPVRNPSQARWVFLYLAEITNGRAWLAGKAGLMWKAPRLLFAEESRGALCVGVRITGRRFPPTRRDAPWRARPRR